MEHERDIVGLATLTALAFLAAGCGHTGPEAVGDKDSAAGAEHMVINGTCAPHGTLFYDEYSCETVEGPAATSSSGDSSSSKVTDPDPDRLDDVDLEWTRAELAACSCICCHSSSGIGGYLWSYEFEPSWVDSMDDERLEHFTDSGPGKGPDLDADTSDAATNNGFSRGPIGVPTTDAVRFLEFMDRERERRGVE